MPKLILITGCSGGGKSTLLHALAAAGFPTVPEPGRRIIRDVRAGGEGAFPWVDPVRFARRALEVAEADIRWALATQPKAAPVFFDRGLIDAAISLAHMTGVAATSLIQAKPCYDRTVFLAPPWPALFAQDQDRQHTFADAVAEYDRIAATLPALSYAAVILPKQSVDSRAAFVRDTLLGSV